MLISQMLRPDDRVRFDTPHYALAPIAGLQMNEPAVEIGDQLLVRCNRAEWEIAERAYVFKDWHTRFYDANPVFLCHRYTEPLEADRLSKCLDRLAVDGSMLVTAMRLFQTGPLLEPIYTARFVVTGAMHHRALGPYRTEYLTMPLDRMTWPLDAADVGDLSAVYAVVQAMRKAENADTFHAIVRQFNLAHTPLVSGFFSVHLLLTALIMLVGHRSVIDGVSAHPYARALALLKWWMGASIDAAFEPFYTERITIIRNKIQHHALRDGEVDIEETRHRLQVTLMIGIRLLMRIHLLDAQGRLRDLKQKRRWQSLKPPHLMNAALDELNRGDDDPMRALMTAS